MIKVPEYSIEARINGSEMRSFDGNSFVVLNVFPPYRYGWDDSQKKFRSFYRFPSRLTDEVVYSGAEEAKPREGDTFSLREKFWDDGVKKFGFRIVNQAGRDFFKTFKKVYDVDISLKDNSTFQVWDGQLKAKKSITLGRGNTFTLQAVPASRIISMIETYELDSDVQLVDGKDKLGNPAKVRPFDFEEPLVKNLIGRFFKMRVRGVGIESRYSFSEANEFSLDGGDKIVSIEDVPF